MINYDEKFKSIETGPKTTILKEALELCTVCLWLDEKNEHIKGLNIRPETQKRQGLDKGFQKKEISGTEDNPKN